MQLVLAYLLIAAVLGAVCWAIWQEFVRRRRLAFRVRKLYASTLYADMKPLLKLARKYPVERIVVDKTGVAVRLLHGGSDEYAFLMRPNGYAYLTPEQQEALRVVLEERIPVLRDYTRYSVQRKRSTLLNGQREFAYHYTIVSNYKTQLMRSHYFANASSRLW